MICHENFPIEGTHVHNYTYCVHIKGEQNENTYNVIWTKIIINCATGPKKELYSAK